MQAKYAKISNFISYLTFFQIKHNYFLIQENYLYTLVTPLAIIIMTYRVSQKNQNYWNNVLLEFECPSAKLNAKMRKMLTGCIY
jgi:hypothetical protein